MRYVSKDYEDRKVMLEDWKKTGSKLNPIYGYTKKAGKYGKVTHQIILEAEKVEEKVLEAMNYYGK